ncbi:MAG: hypothetical protein QG673_2028 [Pseudomonadota bacterium]|nr:hypothetical protein [Pseudomonadota bacterium]
MISKNYPIVEHYNKIPRDKIKTEDKKQLTQTLKNMVNTDNEDNLVNIISCLIAFKDESRFFGGSKDRQENALSVLQNIELPEGLNIDDLLKFVRNQGTNIFTQKQLPGTFKDFLIDLSQNHPSVFYKSASKHWEFLRSNGIHSNLHNAQNNQNNNFQVLLGTKNGNLRINSNVKISKLQSTPSLVYISAGVSERNSPLFNEQFFQYEEGDSQRNASLAGKLIFYVDSKNVDKIWQKTCKLIEECGGNLQAKCYFPNGRETHKGKYDLMIEFTDISDRRLVEDTYSSMIKYGIVTPKNEVHIKPTALASTHDGNGEFKLQYNSQTLSKLYPDNNHGYMQDLIVEKIQEAQQQRTTKSSQNSSGLPLDQQDDLQFDEFLTNEIAYPSGQHVEISPD